ncbi:MAG: hypothetical protein HQL53_12855 [Magnetococcales bacterium]|nr:hypothetical protein [Magnetococcales bacterium]
MGVALSAEKKYYEAIKDVIKILKKPGLMVFQWRAKNSSSNSGGLGTLLGGRSDGQESMEGFGIIGGLRVSTLFLNNDLLEEDHWPHAYDDFFNGMMFKVPTTTYQAKYISYFSSLERIKKLQAKLDATIEDIKNLATADSTTAAWLAGQRLKLEMAISRMSQVSNMAIMDGGFVITSPVNWGELVNPTPFTKPDCDVLTGGCDHLMANDANKERVWLTFYEVGTRLKDLKKRVYKPL